MNIRLAATVLLTVKVSSDISPIVVLPVIEKSAVEIVPVIVGDEIVGAVSVLFDNVSVPANVDNVPVVGSVTLVVPVVVRVSAYAPDVVNAPAVVTAPPKLKV